MFACVRAHLILAIHFAVVSTSAPKALRTSVTGSGARADGRNRVGRKMYLSKTYSVVIGIYKYIYVCFAFETLNVGRIGYISLGG